MRRMLGILTMMAILTAGAQAGEIVVCPEEADGCNYTSIQSAINNAKNGDVIKIRKGIYREHNITINKCISIEGEDRDSTIIDAEHIGRGIYINYSGQCKMKISSITVRNGVTDYGGGIRIYHSASWSYLTLILQDVSISGNRATGSGGGISVYSYSHYDGENTGNVGVKVIDSEISKNISSGNGGGIYFRCVGGNCQLKVENSTIEKNFSSSNSGGMDVEDSTLVNLDRTVLKGNSANGRVGGMAICGDTVITKSWIVENKAKGSGGGIYIYPNCNFGLTIESSVIAFNRAEDVGGGIYFANTDPLKSKTVTIEGCTIVNNTSEKDGNGIYVDFEKGKLDFVAYDTVFVNNNDDISFNVSNDTNYFLSFGNDAFSREPEFPENTYTEEISVIDDPGFVNPEEMDFSLKINSPLIGKGAYTYTAFLEDIAGRTRDSEPDIGACEYPDICRLGETEKVEGGATGSFEEINVRVPFSTGWNLSGIPAYREETISELFGDNLSSVHTLWKWDRNNREWELYTSDEKIKSYLETFPVFIELLDENSTIKPGEGFWVNAKKPFELEWKLKVVKENEE
jgi:predicted outer membrane repeat protein